MDTDPFIKYKKFMENTLSKSNKSIRVKKEVVWKRYSFQDNFFFVVTYVRYAHSDHKGRLRFRWSYNSNNEDRHDHRHVQLLRRRTHTLEVGPQ